MLERTKDLYLCFMLLVKYYGYKHDSCYGHVTATFSGLNFVRGVLEAWVMLPGKRGDYQRFTKRNVSTIMDASLRYAYSDHTGRVMDELNQLPGIPTEKQMLDLHNQIWGDDNAQVQ